jgi:hypothetical protein
MVRPLLRASSGIAGLPKGAQLQPRSRIVRRFILAAVGLSSLLTGGRHASAQTPSALPLQEAFEDASFSTRGWYDTTGGTVSTADKYAGAAALECRFAAGGTNCSGGTPGRHLFDDTESVYLAYYVKHSTNWVGSGKTYQPHMFLFLTNQDGAWVGPAYTHMTAYVEQNAGIPLFSIQDAMNVDESRIGQNLVPVTENRAVAGCNGDSDGYGNGGCYLSGSVHVNGKTWSAGQVYFDDVPGSPNYKADWHLVEAYFKLNSIVNGKAVADGVVRYWYDGRVIMDHSDVVLRTGSQAAMRFNQLLYAPHIGDGSPLDQRFWIDSLLIATARPSIPPFPPGGAAVPPRAPTNVRVIVR